jgi:predicted dehydrogenase
MPDRLRVGVIGLGAFGESHIRAYQGLPFVEIAAVASRSSERAMEIAKRYNIPSWYGSYGELISNESIQAVSITTAESEHREPAVEALAVGKHVLVEKPLASTAEDASAILAAARNASGILMPGHVLRFDPRYASLRSAAVSGAFGRLVSLSARRNRSATLIPGYSRVHPALVTAIHDIDIMLWTNESGIRSVYAIDRLASRDNGAHGLWSVLEFADGTVATIESSWLVPDTAGRATDDAFQAVGLEGTGRIQLDTPSLQLWRGDRSEAPDVNYEPVLHGVVTGALRDELSHFAQCALTSTPSRIVTPEDGANALAVVLAIVESAQQGQPVVPQPRV